jgi:FkbM family methyltransferase
MIEVAVAAPGILHPVYLRARTTDIGMCREILVKRQYSCEFQTAPRVIVDAGANIGLTSVFFANKYPNAHIIALEPEVSNYRMLQRNISAYPNIKAINAALWSENCELDIFDPEQGHSAFQVRCKSEAAYIDSRRAHAITLDALMSDLDISHIDLLKVDIEGAEKEVFSKSLRWIGCVDAIAIELHDWLRPGCRESVKQAAGEFNVEWSEGETTYLAKQGSTLTESRPPFPVLSPETIQKFPLKILSIEPVRHN